MNLTEKYRPESFDELVGQNQIKERLEDIELDDLQHLLFIGRAGIGKTTVAHILKNEVYDNSSQKMMNFMEMNASTENSIDDIRSSVRDFVKTAPTGASKNILFLDEADNLSKDAQQALRRVMEKHSNNCVFILSGNYEDQFIDPIKSRCMTMEFDPISEEDIVERLEQIAGREDLEYTEEALQQIAEESGGDIRDAINSFWFSIEDGKVVQAKETNRSDIEAVGKFLLNERYVQARNEKDKLLKKGVEPQKFIQLLYDFAQEEDIPEEERVIWYEELADADHRMSNAVVQELQLEKTIWNIAKRTKDK